MKSKRLRVLLDTDLLVLLAVLLVVSGRSFAAEPVPVYAVAGQGMERIDPDGPVRIRGVVTGVFLEEKELNGFFIQGEVLAPDGLPSGLFVYAPDLKQEMARELEPGRIVRLTGKVGEYHSRPELEGLRRVELLGEHEPRVHPLRFPLRDPERLEGILVRSRRELTVTGNSDLARYGSLELAAGGRAYRKRCFRPGEGPNNPTRTGLRLILDDGRYGRGLKPVPYLNDHGTRRVGSRMERGLTGIFSLAFGNPRIHPTRSPEFRETNPRPDPLPEPEGEAVRVAVLNTESYFLTLGERGADSEAELRRQRAKLLAGAKRLSADILVLLELENRDRVVRDFQRHLARFTDHPWRLVRPLGSPSGVIRIAMVYRSDQVLQMGQAVWDHREIHDRPPFVAAFRPRGGGAPFAVAGVHFKSKSDCPNRAADHANCWNRRRVRQARALIGFLRKWRWKEETPVLIAGDLNAYCAEEPVRVLEETGWRDVIAAHMSRSERVTYVYSGESGRLDYLLARDDLAERVLAVHVHSINAEEPPFLEYDRGGPGDSHLSESAFRCSDHNPVAVDISPH